MRRSASNPHRMVAWSAICCGFFFPYAAWSQSDKLPVDFTSAIKPLLESKCYECHGPMLRSGGVRFDERAGVASGGYSQKPLLGGTLQTNEIYLRVTSDDPSYRMPKGKPPLSTGELDLVRRWVEAGTPWPVDPGPNPGGAGNGQWLNREAWLDYSDRWLTEVPGLVHWLCVMLVLQFGLLFTERYKRAVKQERPWTTSSRLRWLKPLQHVGVTHYLLLVSTMGLILSVQVICGMQFQRQRLEKSLAELRSIIPQAGVQSTFTVYGNPPIPKRPSHPPRLSGIYYRGNCERSPQLFNGGNYRTATLHVSLIDKRGHTLKHGDRVSRNGLSIRFELERAVGTTEDLFGDGIVKGVFLTRQVLTETGAQMTEPVERIKVIKPGWKWEATFPLRGPHDEFETVMSGLIYVYQGAIERDRARGTLHYGIKYNLRLKDLALEPQSEVWLGSLFWSQTLQSPHEGQVPLSEWFNDHPIPEITGKNSTDPKLLGIPEHLKKPGPKD